MALSRPRSPGPEVLQTDVISFVRQVSKKSPSGAKKVDTYPLKQPIPAIKPDRCPQISRTMAFLWTPVFGMGFGPGKRGPPRACRTLGGGPAKRRAAYCEALVPPDGPTQSASKSPIAPAAAAEPRVCEAAGCPSRRSWAENPSPTLPS